jgi:hypothetical protein
MDEKKTAENNEAQSTVEDIAILEEAVATSVGTFGTPK